MSTCFTSSTSTFFQFRNSNIGPVSTQVAFVRDTFGTRPESARSTSRPDAWSISLAQTGFVPPNFFSFLIKDQSLYSYHIVLFSSMGHGQGFFFSPEARKFFSRKLKLQACDLRIRFKRREWIFCGLIRRSGQWVCFIFLPFKLGSWLVK